MKKLNVMSCFDGMSCGQIALDQLNMPVGNYFAAEINQNAIKVTMDNYPNTIQLGDITKIKGSDLPQIDLLIGGSPCQGFSISGKKLYLADERSALFFEYLRLLRELKPKYFLLENVRMPDRIADAIDIELGVKRVFIDSRDFTGHIRKRYYWTNIPIGEYPKQDIKLKDIIDHENVYDKPTSFLLDRTVYAPNLSKDGIITINPKQITGKQTWQRGRVYDINGNCPTICATLFDLNITDNHETYRKLTISECEKLQGVPNGYTKSVTKAHAGEMLGNGWTVDVVQHILSGIAI